jgi:hypothetical protein
MALVPARGEPHFPEKMPVPLAVVPSRLAVMQAQGDVTVLGAGTTQREIEPIFLFWAKYLDGTGPLDFPVVPPVPQPPQTLTIVFFNLLVQKVCRPETPDRLPPAVFSSAGGNTVKTF